VTAQAATRRGGKVEYTIEFGEDPHGVVITTSGSADLAAILRANEEFLADARFRPGMPILADHSALDTSSLASSDTRLIGEAYREFLDRVGESAIAIVVAHPATFGLVRMAEAYAGPPPPSLQRIFYSRDEALAWLRDPILQYRGDCSANR
jgi:hypothetical protein